MKVLLLSTSDIEGGAARAAFRLHQGLRDNGVESRMFVQSRSSSDPDVVSATGKFARGLSLFRPTIDQLPQMVFHGSVSGQISSQWFPDSLANRVNRYAPDALNIHWINKGFMKIETLRKFRTPIVMTLHDMWAFTGGCHHSGECERFRDRCGSCPQLLSTNEHDLTRWVWKRKERAWRDVDFTVVCPSHWMASQAQKSALFAEKPVLVIHNGLNIERFRPIEKSLARSLLGLPQDRRLLLFCAHKGPVNKNKGFNYIPALLSCLNDIRISHDTELVILGEISPLDIVGFSPPVHCLGHLHDEVSLALAYSSADVSLMLSHMENFPNTVIEAMACGVPCAGFNVGGVGEMIDHQINGYLTAHGELSELASGIDMMLSDDDRWKRYSAAARSKAVSSYDQARQAREYTSLFQQISDEKQINRIE